MADYHGNSGGSGKITDISTVSPMYSSAATDSTTPPPPQIPYGRLTKERRVDPSEKAPESQLSKLRKGSAWRPFTLRPPTLLFFLFSAIGLITAIEALDRISTRNGALTFADPQRGFSMVQMFCYRYLPQIVIVLYGVGWAAVDLDVKRLEPYFQLSKPGGASASDSILLHYPFDVLVLVPITAAKRRFVIPATIFGTRADRSGTGTFLQQERH